MGSLDYTVSSHIVCILGQEIFIAIFESVLIEFALQWAFELPILFITSNTLGRES